MRGLLFEGSLQCATVTKMVNEYQLSIDANDEAKVSQDCSASCQKRCSPAKWCYMQDLVLGSRLAGASHVGLAVVCYDMS